MSFFKSRGESLCKPYRLCIAVYFIFISVSAHAQPQPYYFSALSKAAYPQKITELGQRKIPVVYTDKKEQKAYEGIIKSRNEELKSDFENDMLIDDTMLINKCKRIIHRIMPANNPFPEDSISLYINRSPVANACCHGEGTLYVNLGLFLWIDNEDELALVLGHELSHQLLNHSESKIRKNIALLSSDDFIEEMKSIRKSTDGKYERYKALMKDLVTQTGTHSRYKESEADSLGIILVKNAGYNVQNAALILLKLDKVDELFTASNLYDVKSMFAKYSADGLIHQMAKKYNGLSMVEVTMNADKDFDSVKTHPDCIVRFKKTSGLASPVPVNCCSTVTPLSGAIKEHALAELVRYEFEANHLTVCSHLCLFALKNGFSNAYYSDFLTASFAGIFDADKHLEKFSATDSRAKAGSTLKELQDYIFNANSESLAAIAAAFLNGTPDKNSEDYHFAQYKYDTQVKAQDAATAEKNFLAAYPNSKYTYLLKPKTR